MSAELLRKYETILVTRTDAGHEAQRRLYEKITEMMSKADARHIRFELWGKRRLAYPIAKTSKGIYMYYMYLADNGFVKDLNRTLKLSNIVLRYLTVRLSEAIDPEKYDMEAEKHFDALPSEADENGDHGRAATGWEGEFAARAAAEKSSDDDDEDEDDDEDDDDDDAAEAEDEDSDEADEEEEHS